MNSKQLKHCFFILLMVFCFEIHAQLPRELLFSTFVGGVGNNVPVGMGMTQNKIYIAGNFDQVLSADTNINLFTPGNFLGKGKIIVINADTRTIETVIHVGNEIYDFAMQDKPPYRVVVACDTGVVMINTQNNSVLWRTGLGYAPMKLSINEIGDVALIFSSNLMYLLGNTGEMKAGLGLPYDFINDIAIIGNRMFVTGFNYDINSGSFCQDSIENYIRLQIAYLACYTYSESSNYPTLEYTTWGFKGDDMNCDIAYTQGLKLAVGQNGLLYFLGETVNENNIFRWNGKTNLKLSNGAYPPSTYNYNDPYNNPVNVGSLTTISYAAAIDPATGIVINGQFILSRNNELPISANNTDYFVRNGSIAADPYGNVYIGGMAGNSILDRSNSGIGNTSPAMYAGGDPALLASQSLYGRSLWQTFTSQDGKGSVSGIAFSSNYMAALVKVDKGNMITHNAILPTPFNPAENDEKTDVLLAVWKKEPAVTAIYNSKEIASDIIISNESISYKNLVDVKETAIYNLQGTQMPSTTSAENEIFFKNLPPGLYFVRITTQSCILTKKFIAY